jgi:hypothetical protein
MYSTYGIITIFSMSGRGGRKVHRLREFSLILCTVGPPRPLIQSVHIQFDLLRMSIILLETCRGLYHYMNKDICALIW